MSYPWQVLKYLVLFLARTVLAALILLLSSSPVEQVVKYPARIIHIVVGYAAGGSSDTYTRSVAQPLTEILGQQILVENRPGESGNVAAFAVIKAKPDGHTLLSLGSNNLVNHWLFKNKRFDILASIAPVAQISSGYGVLVVHPDFPAKTIPEFIRYAQEHRGLLYGAAGVGSSSHLFAELLNRELNLGMLPLQYKGNSETVNQLVGGHIQVMFSDIPTALPFIRSGDLRPLGVTSPEPLSTFPGLPAIAKFVPDYRAQTWIGIGAPKETPEDILLLLNQVILTALGDKRFKEVAERDSSVITPMNLKKFRSFVEEDFRKWEKVIRDAKIQIE